MKHGWLAVAIAAMAFGFGAYADTPACPELNTLWADRYHADFKVDGKAEPFACPSHTSKTALAFFDLYAADTGRGFYYTAKRAISKLKFGGRCEDHVLARTTPDGFILLCDRVFEADREKRASTLFHESAHTRKDDPGHVKCDHGVDSGRTGCDDSLTGNYSTGSGYNWEAMYLRFVRENSQLNDLTRWAAKEHLKHLLANRFNKISAKQIKEWSR
jgi:hypothetical protein